MSQSLLTSSEKFHEAKHSFASHGVKLGSVELDLQAMMARKTKVVKMRSNQARKRRLVPAGLCL
ncbi:hypothetical protein WCLP8_5380002 [uncultured Gammaproteobacteria bacterium]